MRALLALALFATAVCAQPPEKGDAKPVTKVYDARHLLGDRGRATNLTDADALTKRVFEAVPALADPKSGARLVVLDGTKLELHAPPAAHTDLRDLLAALDRLQDVATNLETTVYELDAPDFEKLLKGLPKGGRGKPGSPVLVATGREFDLSGDHKTVNDQFKEVNAVLKTARTVHTAKVRLTNGTESEFAARHTLVPFRPVETVGAKAKPDTDVPQLVKDGFRLRGTALVSSDRRYIRFAVTEQSTAFTGIDKIEFGEFGGREIVLNAANTEDLGGTGSAVVADGGFLLFKLAYAPKGKVLVAALGAKIYIRTEEDELKRLEKQDKK
jgi:hypothetical protein